MNQLETKSVAANESTENKSVDKLKNYSTVNMYITDAKEALTGIPADLLSGTGTLIETFTKNNRLRGLGVILVLFAVLFAVLGLVA